MIFGAGSGGGPVFDGFDVSTLTGAAGGTTLAVIVGMLLARKGLVPEWTLNEADKRAEEYKAERDKALEDLAQMQTFFEEQVIPALTRATDANTRYLEEAQRRRWESDKRAGGGDQT